MTLEIHQLMDQIEGAADTMAAQRREHDLLAREAGARLEEFSTELDLLKRKIEIAAINLGGNWRGASPKDEPIGAAYDPPGDAVPVRHIIATDGSQIYPDRHGIAPYALVNIGAIHLQPGSGEPPAQVTYPDLIYGERLQDDEMAEALQAADISRERDRQELSKLITLSTVQRGPVVALMDSPLLLWILGQPGQRGRLEAWFVGQLQQAQAAGVLLAGYVDRPGSRGVASLLALAPIPEEQITQQNSQLRRFKGMPDRAIFRHRLEPGQRSALFVGGSPFNPRLKRHDAGLEIVFFYLNVGRPGDAAIARVETPAWVAGNPGRLGQLHAAIWDQCQAPGRYPYALARAHEIAVVNRGQRDELENILVNAMLNRGLTPQVSAKSSLKQLTDR
jgi:hypothetical protein